MKSSEQTSLLLSVLIVIAAVWTPVADLGFIWDDDDYVVENPLLDDAAGLREIWLEPGATPQYYPMVFTSFALERALFGQGPRAHHVTNVALHLLSALLLWAILTRLRIAGAWLAAALFLVHPVHVESVAWISERKNVLSLAFALGATLAWLRFDERTSGRWRAYAWTVLLFALALLSKTVTSVLPAVFLLIAWLRRGGINARDLLPTLPLAAMSLAAGAMTASIEQSHVFKKVFTLGLEPLDRIEVAGRALWFYAGKLALPTDISFSYPRFVIGANSAATYLYPGAVILVLLGLFAARRRIGRGALVAAVSFVLMLAPALGFVDVYPMIYSFVADHFQYHASVALLALGAAVAAKATRRLPTPLRVGLCALVLAGLGWQSHQLIPNYQNEETLWRATLARNPSAVMAYVNLALIEHEKGDKSSGLQRLLRGAEVPADQTHPFVRAQALYYVGWSLIQNNRASESRQWFERSIEAHSGYLDSYPMLAQRHLAEGRRADAIAVLERALNDRPDYVPARRMLQSVQHHH